VCVTFDKSLTKKNSDVIGGFFISCRVKDESVSK